MRLAVLKIFALCAVSVSAAAIEDRQLSLPNLNLLPFNAQSVISRLNNVFDAFNKTAHPTVAGSNPPVPANFTGDQLSKDLAAISLLLTTEAIGGLVTGVTTAVLTGDVQTVLCEAIRAVLRVEKQLATLLDNTFANGLGTLNSASNLVTIAQTLTALRKSTQNFANALVDTLKVIPQCADLIKDRERDTNRVFAGLILTMHQKPNTITQTVTDGLLTTLNISGGITGSAFAELSGKPSRRALDVLEERGQIEEEQYEARCEAESSG